MTTRLWTPEDLLIKPLFWFDPEIQKPAFGNVYWDIVSRSDVSTSRGGVTFNYGYFLNNGWACVGKVNETSWPEFFSYSSSSSFTFSVNISSIDFYKQAKYSAFFLSRPYGSYSNHLFSFGSINSRGPFSLARSTSRCYMTSYYSDGTSHTVNKYFEGEVNEALIYSFIDFQNGAGGITYNGNNMELLEDVPSDTIWSRPASSTVKTPYASFSACEIAEIIAYYDVLSDEDRQKVEGYMMHRWKLANLLPLNHPYKEKPPEVVTPDNISTSSITVPSNPVLFVSNINTRIGDTRLAVGGIPFYNLEAPKDSYTGKTVSGMYKYYGTDKFITVPKDTSSMYISTLFVPDNQVKYGITPCQVLLKFN